MKIMRKSISVLTFILAIVSIVISCNFWTHEVSAEITGVTSNVHNIVKAAGRSRTSAPNYDRDFDEVRLDQAPIRATNLSYRLYLSNIRLDQSKYNVNWTTSDERIATVSGDGTVYTKSAGTAEIKASIVCDNNAVYSYTTEVRVTDPHFRKANVGMQIGNKVKLKIDGASSNNYTIDMPSTNVVKKTSSNKFKALRNGEVTVSAWVDGKQITSTIYVTNPKLKSTDFFITRGSSERIKIKRWSGNTEVQYYSSDSRVATVDSDGRIYANKDGSCVIDVYVDNKKLTAYVAVGNQTVVNTLKSAYGCLGCKYSQARRMSKKYFDCSSFVWRNYSKYGVNFGDKKYAPPASIEAKNMVKTKKKISYKYLKPSKLRPGDVIFTKSSSKNGKYRNIGHVVIYMGNGRIIHATPPKVTIGKYSSYKNRIAVIARPTR